MKSWFKPAATLIVMGFFAFTAPKEPLDPWNLISPKIIASMIFALAMIQIMGVTLAQYLGARMGAILTGFLGGLVSSTATTASLARKSKTNNDEHDAGEILTYLAATFAMLLEGLVLVVIGARSFHLDHVMIFLGPMLVTLFLCYRQSRKVKSKSSDEQEYSFRIRPLLKLGLFIVAMLAGSKVLQQALGQSGLYVVTFLVALFELHGSVIANVQLFDTKAIDGPFLSGLLAIAILATYVSKLFLIWFLGSRAFQKKAIKFTALLFVALVLSWIPFSQISV